MTTNVRRVHPFQVLLPAGDVGLRRDSEALADRCDPSPWSGSPRTPERCRRRSCTIDDALRLHLVL